MADQQEAPPPPAPSADELRRSARTVIVEIGTNAIRDQKRRSPTTIITADDLRRATLTREAADLELARMLDEMDTKFDATVRGIEAFSLDMVDSIDRLEALCASLERRTIGGRWRRLKTWCRTTLEALREPTDAFPDEPELPSNYEPDVGP